MADDAELLRQIEHGDESAFATLIDRHGQYLHGIAHALSGNRADAEDLVQETLMAVLSSRFRAEASVRTWLVKILVKRAAMLRRTKSRKPTTSMDAARSVMSQMSAAGASEARMDLTTMLTELSPDHRAVIVLRELEQMSYEEIASTLEVPRGTVESRLHRAREELRKRFRDYV